MSGVPNVGPVYTLYITGYLLTLLINQRLSNFLPASSVGHFWSVGPLARDPSVQVPKGGPMAQDKGLQVWRLGEEKG